MKLTVKYSPILVNTSKSSPDPKVIELAKCHICSHKIKQDETFLHCNKLPGAKIELFFIDKEAYWCSGFEYDKTKYFKLL